MLAQRNGQPRPNNQQCYHAVSCQDQDPEGLEPISPQVFHGLEDNTNASE